MVGKMAQDIVKVSSVVPTLFGYFFGVPSLYSPVSFWGLVPFFFDCNHTPSGRS